MSGKEHLFKPGNKMGKGRPAGALNRTTEQMRLTINRAVNNTLSTIQQDLEELKKKNPEKALELSMRLMEYAMPKMRSIDIQGTMEVNAKIQSINLNIVDGTKHNNIKDI